MSRTQGPGLCWEEMSDHHRRLVCPPIRTVHILPPSIDEVLAYKQHLNDLIDRAAAGEFEFDPDDLVRYARDLVETIEQLVRR